MMTDPNHNIQTDVWELNPLRGICPIGSGAIEDLTFVVPLLPVIGSYVDVASHWAC